MKPPGYDTGQQKVRPCCSIGEQPGLALLNEQVVSTASFQIVRQPPLPLALRLLFAWKRMEALHQDARSHLQAAAEAARPSIEQQQQEEAGPSQPRQDQGQLEPGRGRGRGLPSGPDGARSSVSNMLGAMAALQQNEKFALPPLSRLGLERPWQALTV